MSRSVHVVGLVCFLFTSSAQLASAQTTVVQDGTTTNAQALAAKIDQYSPSERRRQGNAGSARR